ncbi:MAG: hypothetical protein EP344_00690 [Bacteroidetes bacterium]|nr:MAG: hypothetical protein EP344_00690 [Bacteroidota bacterium]
MGILFGVLVLALLVAGLFYQRRQNKAWVKEERYEESGNWIDKRAGERGTYGSRDAERETERQSITREGRVRELAQHWRNYAFEQYPGFHEWTDDQIRKFTTEARGLAREVVEMAEHCLKGRPEEAVPAADPLSPHPQALKRITLNYLYDQYPALLDRDIEVLQRLDRALAAKVSTLLR